MKRGEGQGGKSKSSNSGDRRRRWKFQSEISGNSRGACSVKTKEFVTSVLFACPRQAFFCFLYIESTFSINFSDNSFRKVVFSFSCICPLFLLICFVCTLPSLRLCEAYNLQLGCVKQERVLEQLPLSARLRLSIISKLYLIDSLNTISCFL